MEKKNGARRGKRHHATEDNSWDCSVCTYRNTAEAFKCLMCDVRKGTSTRKPRLNQALVAQQAAQQYPAGAAAAVAGGPVGAAATTGGGTAGARRRGPRSGGGGSGRGRSRPARLRDVDRSSAQTREVTVNSVTVVITEYRPKRRPSRSSPPTSDLDSSDTKP
ncbi:ring and YY1 binding protein [Arctopsyche grandis]|uniref:ring and YY1 binding protein n=1 Tax=Arctopsyche grandis TaxID=121162 RepID=UPI00406D6C7D